MDFFVGDPPNQWHPVAWMGRLIGWAIQSLPTRGRWQARVSGGLTAVAGAALFGLLMFVSAGLLAGTGWLGLVVQAALLKLVLSVRGLLLAGARVEGLLAAGELEAARAALGRDLVSRPTAQLSSAQVASGAIESLVENLTDSVVAPLLAFALGGLPAAWAYRYINTADAMIGYRDAAHRHVGLVAARLDDAVNWIPARLTGPLVALASGFALGRLRPAWRTMMAQHGRTQSPNAGWTMAAAAGGLGVRLEKRGAYQLGMSTDLPGIGHLQTARTVAVLVAVMATVVTLVVGAVLRVWL